MIKHGRGAYGYIEIGNKINMDTQDSSIIVKDITNTFLSHLIGMTKINLKTPINFIDHYNKVCRNQNLGLNNEIIEVNLEIRQHVRNNLIENGYVTVDPTDVDSVYLTQKAFDEFSNHHSK